MDYATQNLAYVENFIKMMNSASEMRNRGNQNLLQGMGMLTDVGTKYGLQKGEQDFKKELIGKTVTTPGIPAPPETISQTETKTIPGMMNYPSGMNGMPTQDPSATETTTKNVPNPKYAEWQNLLKQGKTEPKTTFIPGLATQADEYAKSNDYTREVNSQYDKYSKFKDRMSPMEYIHGYAPDYGGGSDKNKNEAMADLNAYASAVTNDLGSRQGLQGSWTPDPMDSSVNIFNIDSSKPENVDEWKRKLKSETKNYEGSLKPIINSMPGANYAEKKAEFDRRIDSWVDARVMAQQNKIKADAGNGGPGLISDKPFTILPGIIKAMPGAELATKPLAESLGGLVDTSELIRKTKEAFAALSQSQKSLVLQNPELSSTYNNVNNPLAMVSQNMDSTKKIQDLLNVIQSMRTMK